MVTRPDEAARNRRAFVTVARSLAQFLRDHDEKRWSGSIATLAERAEAAGDGDDIRQVASQTLRLFGGMGSLNDVMLPVDGSYPREVNARLDALTSELYTAAHALIPSR
ncbi:DUF6966 domain-containing protein [Microbacterium hydrothermale]|uniref:DUF6966 domain-containing protein n=1 Tax=Microbacterium hydrothermale TaxID=857427 RepID=UPI0010A7B07D|nr:hypothetical protein [Microbacterium hydrothermale]